MRKPFYLFANIAQIVPLSYYKRWTNKYLICPYYHVISNDEIPHIKHLYAHRSIKNFKADLDFFLQNYEPIDWTNLNSHKNSQKSACLLTFDDGMREFYEIAAPILKEKGIPAICFVNSDFIDNKDLFFRYKASLLIEQLQKGSYTYAHHQQIKNWFLSHALPFESNYKGLLKITYNNRKYLDELAGLLEFSFNDFLKKKKPYMTSNQINELIDDGFFFGAHSMDHPHYDELSFEQQKHQTFQSLELVRNKFSLNYNLFSFPFNDKGVHPVFFDWMFNSQTIIDLAFGTDNLQQTKFDKYFHRIWMEGYQFSAKKIIIGEYLRELYKYKKGSQCF